jgi:signal transduction histidine kinase
MPRPRLPLALLWPTGLVLLVGVLAFFQYRWLGQVSESERDRLRSTLDQRAREFADDFDRDIGRAYSLLQTSDDVIVGKEWETFAKRYDEWKAGARFPQLIRNIYISIDPNRATSLEQFDPGARQFQHVEWPAELEGIKARIRPFSQPIEAQGSTTGTVRFLSIGASPVVSEIPALLIPVQPVQHTIPDVPGSVVEGRVVSGRPVPPDKTMLTFRLGPSYLILELDRAFIINTMLPTLVERHFAVDDYHVQVMDQHAPTVPIFARGAAPGAAIAEKDADATIQFFSVRMEGVREAVAALRPLTIAGTQIQNVPAATKGQPLPSSPTTTQATGSSSSSRFSIVVQERGATAVARASTMIQYGGGAYRLVLQHPAGSLEAAVSRARVRNLSLSFGVLAVLAAGVFLISINAQRAQRLAAQQMDFVATVSHELRTPLAVIRSAAQNLSAGVVHAPEQAKRYGDLIDSEGRRLTDMVEQVLTYAGLSGPRRPIATAPTDIVSLTQDVVASCDALITEAGFVVECTASDDVPEIPLDEGAYRRALSNLIVNALKYGTDGSWVGVDVRTGVGKKGREVQVTVADRGRGIDAADLPHIFEAFYRGQYAKERQIHGNGLGLSLVQRIAEAHGGRVTVTSRRAPARHSPCICRYDDTCARRPSHSTDRGRTWTRAHADRSAGV